MTRAVKVLILLTLAVVLMACGSSPTAPIVQQTPPVQQTPLPPIGDTLVFFLGSRRAESPTLGKRGVAGSSMTTVLEGNRSYTLKHGSRPDSFELHEWDGAAIYLREDHGAEYGGWSYQFDGSPPWLSRHAEVGWRSDAPAYLTVRNPQCAAKHWGPYGIMTGETHLYTELVAHEWRDLGGDLGQQEVIVLMYGAGEEFVYSREWGWVGWFVRSRELGGYWSDKLPAMPQTHIQDCWFTR